MAELNSIETDFIAVSARPGADIATCVREAAIMALMKDRRVILTHNGREFLVDPGTLCDAVNENPKGG